MAEENNNLIPPPETMSPIIIEGSKAPEVTHVDFYAVDDVNTILSQIININKNDILHEPTCLICSSPDRKELEEKWIAEKKFSEVQNLYKSKSGKTISKTIVENHMYHHANSGVREIQKVEYANKINRLNSSNLTTLDRIKLCLSALTERLLGINSIIPTSELSIVEIEKTKSTETTKIMASFNQLLKLQANILGEMKNSGELVTIPRRAFVQLFQDAIINAKSEETKDTIKDILNKLAKISNESQ